jgi:hypothetical protein
MLDAMEPGLHVLALGDEIEQFGECSFASIVQVAVYRHLHRLQMGRFEIVTVMRGLKDCDCLTTRCREFSCQPFSSGVALGEEVIFSPA